MRWSFTVGRIAGIRIELHVTFLLFIGVIAMQNGLLNGRLDAALMSVAMMLLAFTCVLLHELGHALTARRFGIRTLDIIMLPIGGVARLERMPDKPRQEIVVAIAGPAVNLAILIVMLLTRAVPWAVPSREQVTSQVLPFIFVVNAMMLGFNLIPAFPMDGGRVLRAALAMRMPYPKATRIAVGIGQAIALLLGLAGIATSNMILVFIALFVFLAAGEERALVHQRTSLSGVPVRAAMMTQFDVLHSRDPVRRAVDLLLAGAQEDFPVMENSHIVGLLSRSDLVRALQNQGVDQPVEGWARRDIAAAEAGEPLESAMMRMRQHGQHALPVIQNGGLVGLLTLENVSDLMLVQSVLRDGRTPGSAARA